MILPEPPHPTPGAGDARDSAPADARTVRVLVADDCLIVRTGLVSVIGAEPGLEVVGVSADPPATLADAERLRPNVAVLRLGTPGRDAADLLTELGRRAPGTHCLVIAWHATTADVREALARGAAGFLSMRCADDELARAIRAVAGGSGYVGALLAARLIDDGDDPLSARERDVAVLLAHGYTNQEVAARLGISVRTTEAHRAHAMTKLGLSTRAQLVDYAIDRGFMALERNGG